MGTYVTDTGLKRKTLQEIRFELENSFKQVFGPSFETSVDSPNGLLISQLSLSFSKLWELAQEVFVSRDPGQATGVSLDFAAALNGLFRKEATYCKVVGTLFTLSENATIPVNSRALRLRGSLEFSLDETVTINRADCSHIYIYDDGSLKSTDYVFNFTFGTVTLNNTNPNLHNLNALANAIQSAGGHCDFVTGDVKYGLVVYGLGDDKVGITGTMPSNFKVYASENGNFTATQVGYQTCELGELDTIKSSVEGWDKVYNYEAGIAGSDTETDAQLRLRRTASAKSFKHTATDPAIAAHVFDEVPGVTNVFVKSNRTMFTDEDNRPPKSFETFVVGGDDSQVAQVIYQNMPAGIQPYGNTEVVVIDGNGEEQIIGFSRPVAKYLWVKVTYELYNEEVFPGNDSLKSSILDFAEKEYEIGKDVIAERLFSAIYPPSIGGVGKATVQVAVTTTPTGTPSYSSNVISIGWGEYASLAPERITLVKQN